MNSSTTKRGKEKKLKDTFYPKENIHFPTQRERERSLDFNCSVVELGREKKVCKQQRCCTCATATSVVPMASVSKQEEN